LVATIATGLAVAGCAKGTHRSAAGTTPPSTPTIGSSASPHPSEPPTAASPIPKESPIPPENSPPGDIPDNTQFVPYRSKDGGFTVSIPEGWARRSTKTSVSFTDKLNTIGVSWEGASSAPTVSTANSTEVPQLRRTERAFR